MKLVTFTSIRWNYDWDKETTSYDDIQDFKRSFFRNIEPGFVETSTFNQMPIASRSFRVCTNVVFNFSQLILEASARKKRKKTVGVRYLLRLEVHDEHCQDDGLVVRRTRCCDE